MGQAQFASGKSMLAVPNPVLVLDEPGQGFHEHFLHDLPELKVLFPYPAAEAGAIGVLGFVMFAWYNVNRILDHHTGRRRARRVLEGVVRDQLQCGKLHLQGECGLREKCYFSADL